MLLEVNDLSKTFMIKKANSFKKEAFQAVKNVHLRIEEGEVFAVIGESGIGKSTLGKLLLGMEKPTFGQLIFDGKEINDPSEKRAMQVIFQHPDEALNPMLPIIDSVMEPLLISDDKKSAREKAESILTKVGIVPTQFQLFPRNLSGGQKQRIVIARALESQPKFIVADEPVSSLDATIQHQVIALMMRLKAEFQLTYFFISHDLLLVSEIADRIAVMNQGEIVEQGTTEEILKAPKHPYTKRLLKDALIG